MSIDTPRRLPNPEGLEDLPIYTVEDRFEAFNIAQIKIQKGKKQIWVLVTDQSPYCVVVDDEMTRDEVIKRGYLLFLTIHAPIG